MTAMRELPIRSFSDGDEDLGSHFDEFADGTTTWAAWTPNDRARGTERSALDAALEIDAFFRAASERDHAEVRRG